MLRDDEITREITKEKMLLNRRNARIIKRMVKTILFILRIFRKRTAKGSDPYGKEYL